jgi:hypothetical protein
MLETAVRIGRPALQAHDGPRAWAFPVGSARSVASAAEDLAVVSDRVHGGVRRLAAHRSTVELPADRGERLTDVLVLVGRDRQDLRSVCGMLRDDDEDRGACPLDVELNATQAVEWDVEVETVRATGDCQTSVGDKDESVVRTRFDLDLLARLEQSARQ